MTIDFGEPIYVDELPPTASRGRTGAGPAMQAWLAKVEAGKTAELPSKDEDGAHALSRVAAMKKAAGEEFAIETRPVVPGKRYRIFATRKDAEPATPNGKAGTPAPRK